MFKNLKVTFKLGIMLLPLIITIIAQVLYYSDRQIMIYEESKVIYYDWLYEASSLLLNSDRDFYQASLAETTFYYKSDISAEEAAILCLDYAENVDQTKERFEQAIAIMKADEQFYNGHTLRELYVLLEGSDASGDLSGAPSENLTIKELETQFMSDFAAWQKMYSMETQEGDFLKKQELFEQTREHINSVTDLLAKYSEYESTYLQDSIQEGINTSTMYILIIFAAALLISVMTALYLRNNISRITKDMTRLAENDLSFTPHQLNSRDELGALSKAVHTMYLSLKEILFRLKDSATELVDSSKTMTTSTDQVDTALTCIRDVVADIAQAASRQATDAEEATREMMELNDAMEQSMSTTTTLTQVSNQIDQASASALESADELLKITQTNNRAFQDIFDVIDGITKSTEKIGDASRLISQIAEQTNLLSLNASIEAARAGDAGAGFAVVASEIRQLAEQSADAVHVIDNMLADLQANTDRANQQSLIVKDSVKLQNDSVSSNQEKYAEIAGNVQSVNHQITILEQVNQDLETNFTAISDLLCNLSAVSQETAASTEELAATTETITNNMEQIKGTGHNVDQCAQSLWEDMSRFQF